MLAVSAEHEARAADQPSSKILITMDLSGTLDNLSLDLSSEPSMDLTNIISYLAVGRPASEVFGSGGGADMLTEGTNLALGQLATYLQSTGSSIGLDVLDIRQESAGDVTVMAGTHVTNQLYVGVSWPISFRNKDPEASSAEAQTKAKQKYTLEYERLF